jgi:hypothetical protein
VHLNNDHSHPYFSGVHIGGDEKMNNNFVISVTQKQFLIEYARQVLIGNTAFVAKHKDVLKTLYSGLFPDFKQYVQNIEDIFQ